MVVILPRADGFAAQHGLVQARAMSIIYEGFDAPSGMTTPYAMEAGDTFHGRIDPFGDADWVRLELAPGQYNFTLQSAGPDPLPDPYLRLINDHGVVLAANDDADEFGLDAQISVTISEAGKYYLEARNFRQNATGDYVLAAEHVPPPRLPDFTPEEIAQQLTHGYWAFTGRRPRAFDAEPGSVLNVDLSQLAPEARRLADISLSAWEQVSGLVFNRDAGPQDSVHIRFSQHDHSPYTATTVFGTRIISAFVNVGQEWINEHGTQPGSFSHQTFVHEIGHALGLGHAGNYNSVAAYGVHNHYGNDSWQSSVMSYIAQDENLSIDASRAYAVTPMIADIIAIQSIYGQPTLRSGDDIYGEVTTAGGSYQVLADLLDDPAAQDSFTFTIMDQGGIDTLVLAKDSSDQHISLWQCSISSAYGLRGNISIAWGTVIESAMAGSGNDLVWGNSADNLLMGGAGNDTLTGAEGNDTLIGGAGRDVMIGGIGDDLYTTDGSDRIVERPNAGTDRVVASVNFHLGANLEDLELTGPLARIANGNNLHNRLQGSDWNNTLNGRMGNDTLTGGGGRDMFIYNHGNDTITDYRHCEDVIWINRAAWGGGARSLDAVLASAQNEGDDIVFRWDSTHSLRVQGARDLDLLANDLVLA